MRLTEKDKMARYGYKYVAPNKFDNFGEGCNKLGQLEDIEEELGVDLVTLFKALKNGIYKKGEYDLCFDTKLRFMKGEWYLAQPFDENYSYIVKTKDYGKTWALTKEELE